MKTIKRLLFILVLLLSTTKIIAKITYIPSYYSQIDVIDNNTIYSDSAITRELSYTTEDSRFTITVLHDEVTKDRIKSIRRMKAAAGLSIVAGAMNGVSAGLNPLRTPSDAVNYLHSEADVVASGMLAVTSMSNSNALQHLPITVFIENNSEKELSVSDMERGLIWFVPAGSHLSVSVGNPEINHLRIAYSVEPEPKIAYITIQAANTLHKREVFYEDNDVWIYVKYDESSTSYGFPSIQEYIVMDKTTFTETRIDESHYKDYVKAKKK